MKRDNIITAALLIASIGLFAFNSIDQSTEGTYERKTVVVKGDEVKVGLNLGNKAPELNFADPNGKMIALSDLKGKMVFYRQILLAPNHVLLKNLVKSPYFLKK